jgi:flagellar hook-associated protein 3 FlgL
MMGQDFLIHLNRNLNQMHKVQNQLATGKAFSKPSDNPVMVTRALALETEISRNAQYKRNLEDAFGWVETTDGALNELGTSMIRLRELAVASANGTLGDAEYKALENEVNQLIQGIAQTANSKYDGRYLFGGTKTMTAPFGADTETGFITYSGNSSHFEREMMPGVTLQINVTGTDLLGSKAGAGLDVTLQRFLTGLKEAGSTERSALGNDILRELDQHLESVLSLRSKVGATSNRIEAMKSLNTSESLHLTELLSKTEDIDFAEKVMQFAMMENTYKASLSTGAKILQPTLLDYL